MMTMENKKKMLPRGLRNNNPLNIRRTANLWQGLSKEQNDPDFFQFESMAWGYRAAFVVLRTYRNRYGINTVERIVRRWAPEKDGNDTEYYIRKVTVLTGLERTQIVDDQDPRTMMNLVAAMSRVENGVPARQVEVCKGWKLYQG
ncbi:hypothetical protein QUW02_02915 [Bacteroides eggerthii]|jgi:hypothetical protein|uniref:Structural protein P5 n=1 Tax=Bacteroides eggerthii TaxID=28111 RepID=A0ABT7U4V8_9BACE|nr:hypothetical protein [Bacteroides eggerthii]